MLLFSPQNVTLSGSRREHNLREIDIAIKRKFEINRTAKVAVEARYSRERNNGAPYPLITRKRRASFTASRKESPGSTIPPSFVVLCPSRARIFHAANWVASNCETVREVDGKTSPSSPTTTRTSVGRRCCCRWLAAGASSGTLREIVVKKSVQPVRGNRRVESGERVRDRAREKERTRWFELSRVKLDSRHRASRTISDAYRIHSDDDDDDDKRLFSFSASFPRRGLAARSTRIPPSSFPSVLERGACPSSPNPLVKRPSLPESLVAPSRSFFLCALCGSRATQAAERELRLSFSGWETARCSFSSRR